MPQQTVPPSDSMDTALFEHLPYAVFVISDDGYLQKINTAFTALLGYRDRDIKEMRFSDISAVDTHLRSIDQPIRDNILSFELYAFKKAEHKPLPLTMIHQSGTTVRVRLRTFNIPDKAGGPAAAVGILEPEPTRQSKSEQSTKESEFWQIEENYRNILENSGDAIVITDFNGWIVTVNRMFLDLLGYSRNHEVAGRYLVEFTPMEGSFQSTTSETVTIDNKYYQEHIIAIDRLFETGLAKTNGYMLRQDKTVIPVESTLSLLYNRDGEQRGTITICRDRTRQILAEQEIQRSHAFLESVIEATADGIYVVDENGFIVLVNNAVCTMTGYSRRELIGHYALDVLFDRNWSNTTATYEDVFKEGFFDKFESSWRRKDGSMLQVESQLKLLLDEENNATGFVCSGRDITRRKQAEALLRRAHDHLEQKVAERTRDIKEANTALKVLLNNRDQDRITFEKRTLANINELVLPYAEKLRSSGLTPGQKKLLEILETNLLNLIAPFTDKVSGKTLLFTPTELQVANLVKIGKATKDIADIMNLSLKTVEFHRHNIRKKLGLDKKKTNLRDFLLSLQ